MLSNHSKKKKNYKKKNYKNKTQKKKEFLCKLSSNAFKPFEKTSEKIYKKNNINIEKNDDYVKEVVKNLKKVVNPSGIKPNDDFFSYVNERWIKSFEINKNQKYIIQIDDFRLVQDTVYRELIKIIEDYINNSKSEKAISMKNAYLSLKIYYSDEKVQNISKKFVDYINEISLKKSNIWLKLGHLNKIEFTSWGAPFVWSINPDEKNPKIYKCYLEPPQLTLIDVEVYIDDETDSLEKVKYKKNYRKEYINYLNNLFSIMLGKNHNYNVNDIYDVEVEILNAMSCEIIKEDDYEAYNLVSKDEALEKFGFNWEEFCLALGFKKIPNEFVTSNINYLLCGTKLLLEKWDSNKWKTFWIYLFIRQLARWNKKGWENLFKFKGIFESGQENYIDSYIKPVFGIGFMFNTFLTNEYIKKYNNVQLINYVKTMAQDLKTVFIRIIQRNKWLEPKTKKKALEKLHKLKLEVGSPEILREDPILDYKKNEPWGNLIKMALWRHNAALNLVNKEIIDIPVIDWSQNPPKFAGTQAYVVNASYIATDNKIYIPLGYIQKPFVDLDERGLEYNLSRIGFTIAHEMSHALDDWGSKYDEYGRLNNWWTEKDQKEFIKIQDDVIKQYEIFASYDGIIFDAAPTVGEDIADISGLAICLEYLRDFQVKNEDTLPIQSLSFEAFFIYFAIQSRQIISKKAINAQLISNPHPLDKYRCNVPLSRTRIFRAIYDVKKGDKMWWHSYNRIWTD